MGSAPASLADNPFLITLLLEMQTTIFLRTEMSRKTEYVHNPCFLSANILKILGVFAENQNFYSGGGSKLNEVARSYSELAPKINQFPNYEFVWITDGIGWKSARNKLEEAFAVIPKIYNLATVTDFITGIKNGTL